MRWTLFLEGYHNLILDKLIKFTNSLKVIPKMKNNKISFKFCGIQFHKMRSENNSTPYKNIYHFTRLELGFTRTKIEIIILNGIAQNILKLYEDKWSVKNHK